MAMKLVKIALNNLKHVITLKLLHILFSGPLLVTLSTIKILDFVLSPKKKTWAQGVVLKKWVDAILSQGLKRK